MWENRCYSNGIPEELPKRLADSGKAPSYKHIAIAILSNDNQLKSLGFSRKESNLVKVLRESAREQKTGQLNIFS